MYLGLPRRTDERNCNHRPCWALRFCVGQTRPVPAACALPPSQGSNQPQSRTSSTSLLFSFQLSLTQVMRFGFTLAWDSGILPSALLLRWTRRESNPGLEALGSGVYARSRVRLRSSATPLVVPNRPLPAYYPPVSRARLAQRSRVRALPVRPFGEWAISFAAWGSSGNYPSAPPPPGFCSEAPGGPAHLYAAAARGAANALSFAFLFDSSF